jgi:hypothetical protein
MKIISLSDKKNIKKIGIILLAILCLASLISVIDTTEDLYNSGELRTDHTLRVRQYHMTHPQTVDDIAPWMTFDYINVVFGLDPQYLKNVLAITDPQYPNIKIGYYIKSHGLNSSSFLDEIKQSIISYPARK